MFKPFPDIGDLVPSSAPDQSVGRPLSTMSKMRECGRSSKLWKVGWYCGTFKDGCFDLKAHHQTDRIANCGNSFEPVVREWFPDKDDCSRRRGLDQ
jgi:hypothetical protein